MDDTPKVPPPSSRKRDLSVLIGVSACLLGEKVRYDGGHKLDAYIAETLPQLVRLVAVCPEVGIGMGTPRESVQLIRRLSGVSLRTTRTEVDHTDAMREYAHRKIDEFESLGVCGFVLKSRSPSCGLAGVPEHDERGTPLTGMDGIGAFARVLRERLPDLPVAEEHQLADESSRREFLARAHAYRDVIGPA